MSAVSGPEGNLSAVLENYLEIIFRLEAATGSARSSSIAEQAKVSRSTVTSALKALKSLDMVEYSPYSHVQLTDKGRRIGRDIAHRHVVFQEFFQDILQIDEEAADNVACALEHVVPDEVIRRLGQFVLYMKSRRSAWATWQDDYLREEIAKHTHKSIERKTKAADKK